MNPANWIRIFEKSKNYWSEWIDHVEGKICDNNLKKLNLLCFENKIIHV